MCASAQAEWQTAWPLTGKGMQRDAGTWQQGHSCSLKVHRACLWVKDPSRCIASMLHCQMLHQAVELLFLGLLADKVIRLR